MCAKRIFCVEDREGFFVYLVIDEENLRGEV